MWTVVTVQKVHKWRRWFSSALLDATLSVGVYLKTPAEEIPDLSGAATQNIVITLSGEPLSFNETSYQRYAGWDLDDFNESNGRFSAISVSGTQALTDNCDIAISLYRLSLTQSNTDPALILTITPAENDPFFDSDGVYTLHPLYSSPTGNSGIDVIRERCRHS